MSCPDRAGIQRLLAAERFTGVSFSRVATEAGILVELIQHYFTDKDALLRFAYDDAVCRMSERGGFASATARAARPSSADRP